MARNKVGFHFGSQPNATGYGDYIRALDAAGIPAGCMSIRFFVMTPAAQRLNVKPVLFVIALVVMIMDSFLAATTQLRRYWRQPASLNRIVNRVVGGVSVGVLSPVKPPHFFDVLFPLCGIVPFSLFLFAAICFSVTGGISSFAFLAPRHKAVPVSLGFVELTSRFLFPANGACLVCGQRLFGLLYSFSVFPLVHFRLTRGRLCTLAGFAPRLQTIRGAFALVKFIAWFDHLALTALFHVALSPMKKPLMALLKVRPNSYHKGLIFYCISLFGRTPIIPQKRLHACLQ